MDGLRRITERLLNLCPEEQGNGCGMPLRAYLREVNVVWKKIFRRFLATLVVLLGVTLIAFFLVRIGGGDPARMYAGETATLEDIEATRIQMGLDKPYAVQYFNYLAGLLHGDLGYSWKWNSEITALFAKRLPQTAQLAAFALVIAVVLAIPLGMIAGINRGRFADTFAMFFAIVGQSMSTVWLGLLLILIFGVKLKWLPTQGMGSFKHIILPGICLGFQFSAMATRFMRSGMIDVLEEDYITATRARGISKFKIYTKYALKNALLPIVTIVGSQFGVMMAGSVVIENVFAWPGIGQLLIQAINFRDYQLVQSILLVSALIFTICNLIADILYTVIDPRITFN